MQKRISNKTSAGFTLIELLVVIAIISLLVSILLPSLQQAKALAKQVVCSSQLKAIDLALRLYGEDNDGHYPLGGLCNVVPNLPSTKSPLTWYEMLCERYSWGPPGYGLTWPDSLMCPAEEVGFGSYRNGLFTYSHYGANYWIMDRNRDEADDAYNAIEHPNMVHQPSEAILVYDNAMKNVPGSLWTAHAPESSYVSFRHVSETGNILYLDGHINSIDFGTLIEHGTNLRYGIWK